MDVIVYWFGIATACAVVASYNGRSAIGWFCLGMLFSLLALIVVMVLPNLKPAGPSPETHVRCPDCRELILAGARVCKHCGCKLIPQE